MSTPEMASKGFSSSVSSDSAKWQLFAPFHFVLRVSPFCQSKEHATKRERESEVRGRKRNNFGRKLTKKCFFFKNKLQVVVVVDVVVVVVVVVIGLTSVARFRHVSKRSENYSNVFLKKIGPFPGSFSLFLSLQYS